MLDLSAVKNGNIKKDDVILQNVLEEIKNDKEENIIQQDVLKKVKDEIIERIETVKTNGNKKSDNNI